MDITQGLQQAKERYQEKAGRFNALKQEEQELLQELLRLEGEIRALTRMNGAKHNDGKPRTR